MFKAANSVRKRVAHRAVYILIASTFSIISIPPQISVAVPACLPTFAIDGAGNTVATFTDTTACAWTVPTGVTAISEILMVGGGGGGGGASLGNHNANNTLRRGAPGGGGGGGYVWTRNISTSVTAGAGITITVGAGGSGSDAVNGGIGVYQTTPGTAGTATTLSMTNTYTASGGGGGGVGTTQCNGTGVPTTCSGDGGLSGIILNTDLTIGANNGTQTLRTVGFNSYDGAGGGAGAGANGSNGTDTSQLGGYGGNGGAGSSSTITGTTVYYGGGGGGGVTRPSGGPQTGGTGGSDGGGNGQSSVGGNNKNATSFGGGGGGGGHYLTLSTVSAGGSGYNGVVILSYITPKLATPSAPTISEVVGSATSLSATFTADSNAVSYTAKVYLASNGTTQVGSDITNFTSGSTISGLTTGTAYKVKLFAIGDLIQYANSDAGSLSSSFTPTKFDQAAISLPLLSATSKTYPYSEAVTVSSVTGGTDNGALSITSATNGTATGCSYSSGTLISSTSGTCTLTITKASTANYNEATTTATFTFNKADQSAISEPLLSATSKTYPYSQEVSVSSVTGGAGDISAAITSATNGTATGCSYSSGTLISSTFGTCILTISKATNANYNASNEITATFTFSKANQSALTFTIDSLKNEDSTTLSASGGEVSEAISYVLSSGPCSLSGTTLLGIGIGTCEVVATRPENANYNQVQASVSVSVTASNRAGLTSLAVSQGTIVLNSGSSTYAVSVSSTATSISFTPTFTSTFATGLSNGAVITNGSAQSYIPSNGTNTPFNIVITAQDGITTKSYQVTVTKVVTTVTTKLPNPVKVPTVSLAPRITGLSTTSGAVASSVTITGTNLSTTTSVRLSGKTAVIVSRSDTQLEVTVPYGARSGVFSILTPKGSASSVKFTVTP